MLVHLMLELYGCDRELLSNEALVRRVLSGFVVIAQSHISVHAWPEYGEVDIDICSCKEFSQEDAINFAKEMFQTDDVEVHFVVRGNRSLRPETPDPERLAAALEERRSRKAAAGVR